MAWTLVAQGNNFDDLSSTIGEIYLPKGAKLRTEMTFGVPVVWHAMNLPGVHYLFKPFVPEGMDLVRVYGEDGKGFVEMESDPAWLLAVLAFIKKTWFSIIIAGFVIGVVITMIRIFALIPQTIPHIPPIAWIALAGVGIALLVAVMNRRGK